MFDLEEQIAAWRRQMRAAGIKAPELLDELEGHLREHFQRLLAARIPADEAFASAIRQLGDGKLLKREFSKVSRRGWSSWRNNPATLNILGAWFILAGLNAALILVRSSWGILAGQASWFEILLTGVVFLLSCQVLIGLGLLYRRNFVRRCALGWAALSLMLFILCDIYLTLHGGYSGSGSSSLLLTVMNDTGTQRHYVFLGVSLPMIFLPIISYLNAGLLAWTCYFLTRSGTKNLFHSRKAYV